MVPFAGELQVDAVVLEPFRVEPPPEPDGAQQLDRGGLEHPGPLPGLAIRPAASLDHDGVDATEGEQVRQKQAGRPGADDADLSTVLNGHAGATT